MIGRLHGILAELQRGRRIGVDEDLLDGGFLAAVPFAEVADLLHQVKQPLRHRRLVVGRDDAVGDPRQARAVDADHAPAGPAQAGVQTEDASRLVRHSFLFCPKPG